MESEVASLSQLPPEMVCRFLQRVNIGTLGRLLQVSHFMTEMAQGCVEWIETNPPPTTTGSNVQIDSRYRTSDWVPPMPPLPRPTEVPAQSLIQFPRLRGVVRSDYRDPSLPFTDPTIVLDSLGQLVNLGQMSHASFLSRRNIFEGLRPESYLSQLRRRLGQLKRYLDLFFSRWCQSPRDQFALTFNLASAIHLVVTNRNVYLGTAEIEDRYTAGFLASVFQCIRPKVLGYAPTTAIGEATVSLLEGIGLKLEAVEMVGDLDLPRLLPIVAVTEPRSLRIMIRDPMRESVILGETESEREELIRRYRRYFSQPGPTVEAIGFGPTLAAIAPELLLERPRQAYSSVKELYAIVKPDGLPDLLQLFPNLRLIFMAYGPNFGSLNPRRYDLVTAEFLADLIERYPDYVAIHRLMRRYPDLRIVPVRMGYRGPGITAEDYLRAYPGIDPTIPDLQRVIDQYFNQDL